MSGRCPPAHSLLCLVDVLDEDGEADVRKALLCGEAHARVDDQARQRTQQRVVADLTEAAGGVPRVDDAVLVLQEFQ